MVGGKTCMPSANQPPPAQPAPPTSPNPTHHPRQPTHLAIMEEGSNAELVISATDSCSWYAFSAEITGA